MRPDCWLKISEAKACREPIDAYRQRIDPLEIKMRLDRAQSVLGIDAAHFDQEMLRKKFATFRHRNSGKARRCHVFSRAYFSSRSAS